MNDDLVSILVTVRSPAIRLSRHISFARIQLTRAVTLRRTPVLNQIEQIKLSIVKVHILMSLQHAMRKAKQLLKNLNDFAENLAPRLYFFHA